MRVVSRAGAAAMLLAASAQVLVVGGCCVPFVAPRTAVVNVKLIVTTEPENHSRVYVSSGYGTRFKQTGPTTWKPESVTYGDRRFVGSTPCSVALRFQSTRRSGVWSPHQYAMYAVDSLGKETSCAFGAWGRVYTDTAGATHEELYSEQEFPLDYFITHPNIGTMNMSYHLTIEDTEGKQRAKTPRK